MLVSLTCLNKSEPFPENGSLSIWRHFESCVGCFVRQTVRGVTVSCWHGGVEVTVWLETIPWQAPLCHPSQSALELRTVPPGTSLPPARPQRPEQLTPLIYLPLLVLTFSNLHYQLAWSPPSLLSPYYIQSWKLSNPLPKACTVDIFLLQGQPVLGRAIMAMRDNVLTGQRKHWLVKWCNAPDGCLPVAKCWWLGGTMGAKRQGWQDSPWLAA